MADEQNRLVGGLEVLLEPPRGVEVQMVRRLVEQQHVGWTYELPRDTETSALSAAQLRERPSPRFDWIEPKPMSTASTRGAKV